MLALRHQIPRPRRRGNEELTCVDCVEEVGTLLLLLDIGVNQQGVRFGMDVLHHDLETVEASSFRYLNFTAEALDKILVDNAI